MRLTLEQRFWGKVTKGDGCWLWQASLGSMGYGQIMDDSWKVIGAHRASWELAHGQPVPAGMCVCHHCDNPACVRPDHLFLGTRKDNTQDALKKGRLRQWNEGKTHCIRGHAFSGDEWYERNNERCRARENAARAKQRMARLAAGAH